MSQLFASGGQNIGVSASTSVLPMHPGLIPLRMDCLDLLAVQGTLKSLLQHHSSKASILWHSDFFTVQLSHPYMTTGKNTALTNSITSWQIVGETVETVADFILGAPKSLQMVIAAMKLKDACSLEEKL